MIVDALEVFHRLRSDGFEWGLWVKKKVKSKDASADQFALQVYHNSPYLDKSAVFTPGPYAIPILNSFP